MNNHPFNNQNPLYPLHTHVLLPLLTLSLFNTFLSCISNGYLLPLHISFPYHYILFFISIFMGEIYTQYISLQEHSFNNYLVSSDHKFCFPFLYLDLTKETPLSVFSLFFSGTNKTDPLRRVVKPNVKR